MYCVLLYTPTEKDVQYVMDCWAKVKFFYYNCKNLIVPSQFSQTTDISLYRRKAYCVALDLLHFEKRWWLGRCEIPQAPAIEAFLRSLNHDVDLGIFETKELGLEKETFLKIVNIMATFCRQIILNKKDFKTIDLRQYESNITVENLGMGVAEMWRGVPDAQFRGYHTTDENDVALLAGTSTDTDDGSNGMTAAIEGKVKINKDNLPQLVKTCVVASFVENNLHPLLNPMVPTIIMDTTKAQIALYCVKNDILMISECFKWRDGTCFNRAGLFLLWGMINHRYEIVMLSNLVCIEYID